MAKTTRHGNTLSKRWHAYSRIRQRGRLVCRARRACRAAWGASRWRLAGGGNARKTGRSRAISPFVQP